MIFSIFLIVISPFTAFLPALYMTYKLLSRKLNIYKNPWNIGLFALFLWSIFTGIFNHSILSTLLSVAFFIYFCLSIYLQNYFYTEDKIEGFLKYFIYFSFFSAILGIIEKFAFMYFDFPIWKKILGITSEIAANHRIYSTFGNPNVAGAWFAVMIMIALYLRNRYSKKQKYFYTLSIILFVIALYLSGSRGAEIGLLLGLITNYLLKRHKKNVWIFTGLLILIVFIAFTPFEIFNMKNLMYRGISDAFSDRYGIWAGCFKMIKIKPITGWGLLGIYENSLKFINDDMRKVHGHNIWISLTTTLGSIGLLIYLYMRFYVYKGIKSLYHNNCRLVPLLAGIQAVIVGQGLVDFTIMTPQIGLIFISCSALILSLNRKYNNKLQTGINFENKSNASIFN